MCESVRVSVLFVFFLCVLDTGDYQRVGDTTVDSIHLCCTSKSLTVHGYIEFSYDFCFAGLSKTSAFYPLSIPELISLYHNITIS